MICFRPSSARTGGGGVNVAAAGAGRAVPTEHGDGKLNVRKCLRAQAVNATPLQVLLMVCGIRGFVEGAPSGSPRFDTSRPERSPALAVRTLVRADIIETATAARGTTAPPNWYPDPEDEGLLRYWNGTDWTGDRKPVSAVDITGRIQQGIAQAQRSRCSAPVLMRNDNRRSWPTLTSSQCRAPPGRQACTLGAPPRDYPRAPVSMPANLAIRPIIILR